MVQLGWRRRFGVGCGGGRWQIGWRGFPWGQRGSMIVLFDLCRLLACGKAVVRLVPEGGIICRAEFRVEGDVLGGVYFYSAGGRVAAEFTVVGKWVPEVIQVLPIVRCVLGIVVHGMWVELCVGVGAPHVSGVG